MQEIKVKDLNLKQLRQLCGLGLREVAKQLGLTFQGYQYKESGVRTFKPKEIRELSEIFNLNSTVLEVIINNKDTNKFKINVDKFNKV